MKISNQQLFWMILMLNVGINLLIAINLVIRSGHQDAWLSSMISGLIGLGTAYLGAKVSLRHPNQTLVKFSTVILGKWLGKLIVIPYIAQWYLVIPLIMRDQYHFVHTNVLFMTPAWMVIGSMLLVILYTVLQGGVEVIARCTQLWAPILIVIMILTFALTLNNLDWRALFPVYGLTGITSIMAGSLVPASLLGESANIMMLIAFVDKPDKSTKRAAMSGLLMSAFFIMMGILWVLMTFGWHIASKLKYPFFDMVKLVYLMEFIQNMDIFVMAVWLVSIFVKMSVYLFIAGYGTAQWVGKEKKWKYFVMVPFLTTLVLSFFLIRSNFSNEVILNRLWIALFLPLNGYVIPLLLWIVSAIRFRSGKSGEQTDKGQSQSGNGQGNKDQPDQQGKDQQQDKDQQQGNGRQNKDQQDKDQQKRDGKSQAPVGADHDDQQAVSQQDQDKQQPQGGSQAGSQQQAANEQQSPEPKQQQTSNEQQQAARGRQTNDQQQAENGENQQNSGSQRQNSNPGSS
ncbi:GerAB/ArcD/ProY family transporter [Paenibacillus physcomitrellae]|uniref:Uncharacterized protein n=1 Tax=Paenibacillus physcomitrellae TaxID=1619311 RepID=A0ABQ1FX90_9BACL|nr:endospore germination permease [Paenibacillus physcomitrellae]GGA32853.1 hypothetical protein GCM10010917_17400 [Paenibacillus physcomitrellae]